MTLSAPVVISVLSLAVAAFALGWNVYRDVVLKGRLHASVATMAIMSGPQDVGTFLQVSGVNFGPGELTISSVVSRRSSPWRRLTRSEDYYQILPSGPGAQYSDHLPVRLEVGGRVKLMLSTNLYDENWTQIGLSDTFGRTHWTTAKALSHARARYFEQHPKH